MNKREKTPKKTYPSLLLRSQFELTAKSIVIFLFCTVHSCSFHVFQFLSSNISLSFNDIRISFRFFHLTLSLFLNFILILQGLYFLHFHRFHLFLHILLFVKLYLILLLVSNISKI